MRVLMGLLMKLLTDVLCTSSIYLGINRLVSRVVSFLVYVQSELKPTDLIFSSPKSREDLSRAERREEERRGSNRSGEEQRGRRGTERRGEEWS